MRIEEERQEEERLLATVLFQHVARKELQEVLKTNPPKRTWVEKRGMIHRPEEVCTHLEVVLEGRISVQRMDEEGRILTIDTFGPGDVIGANLLFSSRRRYPMQVVAEEKAMIVGLSRPAVLMLTRGNSAFTEDLLLLVSDKSLLLSDKIHTVAHKRLRQRILDFLRLEYRIQGQSTLLMPMSKKELAERLGVERTSLSRALSILQKEGLLEYDAKTIVLQELKKQFDTMMALEEMQDKDSIERGHRR